MLRILSVTIMLFSLLGCKNVQQSDVTGTWVLTSESRQRFLSDTQRKAAAKVVLKSNGAFLALELPEDLLYTPPQAGTGLVTGNGSWKLISVEGRQQIQLNFESITVGLRGNLPYGTQLNVSRGWSAVVLFYFQGGDADQGRRIEFEKEKE